MLVVKVSSGMGNQLFQYVFAQYLSKQYNRPVYLDCSPFKYRYPERSCHLNLFSKLEETHDRRLYNQYKSVLYRFTKLLFALDPSTRRITEKHLVFPPDNKLLYFDGYWQTDRYAAALDNLDALLQPNEPLPDSIAQWLKAIQSTHAISLHVRRGDYLSKPYISTYNVCDAAYYEAAIERIASTQCEYTLFVFSDEPEWVRENLHLPVSTRFIENEAINPFWYIYLMAQCNDNIISNSSFSWWGAYLNRHTDKQVIAPKRWTLNSEATIALDAWEKL